MSGIRYHNGELISGLIEPGCYLNRPVLVYRMLGIHQKIDEYLFHLFIIQLHWRDPEIIFGYNLDVVQIGMLPHKMHHIRDNVPNPGNFLFSLRSPGKTEKIFYDGLAVFYVFFNGL